MSFPDAAGLAGVLMILLAYAGAQLGRMEPRHAPALLLNLAGAGLILWSLTFRFNLAAFLMEAAWAMVALFGLIREIARRLGGRAMRIGETPAPGPAERPDQ